MADTKATHSGELPEEEISSQADQILALLERCGVVPDSKITSEQARESEKALRRTMYHNTQLMLKHYRDIAWTLECFPKQVAAELDRPLMDIDALLDTVDAQITLGNEKLQQRLLSIIIRGQKILRAKKFDYTGHPYAKEMVKITIRDYKAKPREPPEAVQPGQALPVKTESVRSEGAAPPPAVETGPAKHAPAPPPGPPEMPMFSGKAAGAAAMPAMQKPKEPAQPTPVPAGMQPLSPEDAAPAAPPPAIPPPAKRRPTLYESTTPPEDF